MRKFTTAILLGLLVMGCAEYLPISSGAIEGQGSTPTCCAR